MHAADLSMWRRGIAAAATLAVAGTAAVAAPAAAIDTYTVSGYVTHAEVPGVDFLEIEVDVWDDDSFWEWTVTEPDGYWTLDGLADGHYTVRAQAWDYYDETTDRWVTPNLTQAEDEFDVVGGNVTGLDLHLASGATISGQVTLGAGADPDWMEGVYVRAEAIDGSSAGYGYPEPDGSYEIVGLEATEYIVEFDAYGYWDDELEEDVAVNLVAEYWDDAPSWDEADPVDVSGGSAVGIDAELAVGRIISGEVTLPDGAPVEWYEGLSVEAENAAGDSFYATWVDSDGTYALDRLPADEYRVRFAVYEYWTDEDERVYPNLVSEWYDDTSVYDDAELLDLTSDDAVGVNAELALGAVISGTVTLGAGADPTELEHGISVYAESYDDEGDSSWAYAIVDPETGAYELPGLLPISYRVWFSGEGYWDDVEEDWVPSGLIGEYWDDALLWEDADPVDLSGGDVSAIDATLEVGRTVSGTVTLPDGFGSRDFAGVEVYAYSEGGDFSGWGSVAGDGTYTVRGLPAAQYVVEFWTSGYWDEVTDEYIESSLVSEYYDDVYDYAQATLVDVTSGNVTGIDAALAEGHAISGTVSIGDGTDWGQLEGAYITAQIEGTEFWEYGDITPGTGAYTVTRLPDADYIVCVHTGYLYDEVNDVYHDSILTSECYDDVALGLDGDAVTVAGADVAGIDFEVTVAGPGGTAGVVLTDISSDKSSPFYSAFFAEISWFAAQGITTGYPNGDGTAQYRPFGNVTRDAMAAFLFRFAGSPSDYEAPAVSPFVDVSPTQPFYKEICWLAEQGITTGWDVGGGKKEFRPFAKITRDAMAAFLYRFAGVDDWTAPSTSPFVDVPVSNGFYKEITWLADAGITTGWDVGGGKKEFRPFAHITRDAMAAFLYRYDALTAP